MDKGGWQATIHGVAELDMTEHARARARTRTHTHLSKPTECTPMYSEPHCKLWIWGDITCQRKFIKYNKYITPLGDTDNRGDLCGGKKYMENTPLNFAVNPTANCC